MAQRPAPPLAERGYARTGSTSWWATEEESAPELRWPLSIDVYHRMRRQDAQVASVLRAVKMPVGRTSWWIEPNGARDEVVELVSRDLGLPIRGESEVRGVKRTRDRFSWSDHLRLALTSLEFGHSVFEQTYRPLSPGERYFHLRKLMWLPPRSISLFKVARDGGLEYIEQYGTGPGNDSVRLEVGRLVVYCNDREGAGWQGSSLLRPAYKHWLIKDRLLRTQTQAIDRNGMGIPVYTGAENEDDLSAGLAIAKGYRGGDSSGAAIPHGATLQLIGVQGQVPDATPPIRYQDEQIGRAVLAHYLNLDAKGGSYALASVQADTFIQSLQTVAQFVADVATMHVVEDLVDVNWGEEEPAPRIGFEEIGARQAATAQALKLLTDAGIILPDRSLEESIRLAHNLPPKDPYTPAPKPAPEPAAPAPPPAEPADRSDATYYGVSRGWPA